MQTGHIQNETNGQSSRQSELSKQADNQIHGGNDNQNDQSKAITQHESTAVAQNSKERVNMHYQQNFPRISNNYARYDPNLQKNKNVASQDNYTYNQDQQLVATQHTSQQQIAVIKLQTHQEPEQVDQEDQWQIQKRKQHRNQDQAPPKTAWRPVSPPPKNTKDIMQKAPAASGMTPTISIHNNYINVEMQEQQSISNSKEYNKNKTSDQELQATQGSDKDSPSFNHNNKVSMHKEHNATSKNIGMDSVIPTTQHFTISSVKTVLYADEAEGGMDGGCQEKPTNLQEGVSEGENLTHVLHEADHTDPRLDYRAPATTIARHNNQNNQKQHNPKKGDDTGHLQVESGSQVDRDNGQKLQGSRDNDYKNTSDNKQNDEWHQTSLEKQHQQHSKNSPGKLSNNKSRGKMSKKKREAIKRKQQKELENQGKNRQKSDYDVINSEDEFDEDTQSLNESDDDEKGDETSAHLIKAFGSTFRSEFQAEIQEVADQQGLSPRVHSNPERLVEGNLERPSGRMIYAFAIPLGTVPTTAEVQAASHGIFRASNMDIRKFTEVD
ncbi:hypothetical protein H5410_061820 [Solanum commersonii]|uniref:Uncharacterized protein n=1 Tax=Solanum commersonii TaxID=4109 RepID=A0A9J5WAS6_SOLCO|nr:hypothetical protein H5410_061820 [Solanum commersonii]